MLPKKTVCYLVIVLLASASAASIYAQRGRGGRGVRTGGIYSGTRGGRASWYGAPAYGYSNYGYGGYGYGGVSATPAQGMADVIRAQGSAANSYAQASVKNEEARGKYLENKEKYREMRAESKKRNAESKKKIKADQKIRADKRIAAREKKHADEGNTQRKNTLSDSQLDPNTGKIYWPEELQNSVYKADRDAIDESFLLKNSYSNNTSSSQETVDSSSKKMLDTLKSRIHDISSLEYVEARRFIDRLKNEART